MHNARLVTVTKAPPRSITLRIPRQPSAVGYNTARGGERHPQGMDTHLREGVPACYTVKSQSSSRTLSADGGEKWQLLMEVPAATSKADSADVGRCVCYEPDVRDTGHLVQAGAAQHADSSHGDKVQKSGSTR